MHKISTTFGAAALLLAAPHVAFAQSFKDQIVGAWTLVEGSEVMPDG